MDKSEATFDDIIKIVGNNGKYQKRFKIIFCLVLTFFTTLIYMNVIYSMVIPDHWCFVPGKTLTNLTTEQWKNYSIPRDLSVPEKHAYSKCTMYNISLQVTDKLEKNTILMKENAIIDCKYGWEYNNTWYKKTAPSQENWVCDKELNVANALAVAKIGEVIGTLIFGQLGDKFGRKRIFFVTIVIITMGQTLLTFTSHNLPLFLFFMFIGNSTTTQLLVSPLIIAMEISKNEERTSIALMQRVAWTIGLCSMAFLMWIIGDWVPFMLITTLPMALFLFSNRFIIESPRWLASKGKVSKCIKELRKIAEVNGTTLPEDLEESIQLLRKKDEKVYGVISLVSSWRLAKNGFLIVTGCVAAMMMYFILTLNVSNLGGNPFLNYFWQGLAELPGYIIGKYCCDVIGRRWTKTLAFLAASLGSIPLIFTILNTNYEILSSTLVIFLKFIVSLLLYTIQLQSLEIYPTCVRQTGLSVGMLSSNAAAILSPYIVYLGTSTNASYPFVACLVLSLAGMLSGFFLPETLNMKLPETLADAKVYGVEQKYFNFKYNKKYQMSDTDDK